MSHQTRLLELSRVSDHWCQVPDGDPTARALFHRHYSYAPYRDGRRPVLFVGPGEKLVLVTAAGDALLVWRRFQSSGHQDGVNCAVYRNEGPLRSSDLLREAMDIAWDRWPGERLYTYVNPRRIRSSNPGCCFKKAGWKTVGLTRWNRLVILACCPEALAAQEPPVRVWPVRGAQTTSPRTGTQRAQKTKED